MTGYEQALLRIPAKETKRDHKLASSPLQIVYFFLDTHKNMGILSFTFIDCLFSFLAIPKENNPCTNKLIACLLANACARKKNRKKKAVSPHPL